MPDDDGSLQRSRDRRRRARVWIACASVAHDRAMRSPMSFALLQADGSSGVRWLDILGLASVAVLGVLGAMRGLWWQLVRLLGLIAVIAVARALAPRLSPQIQEWFPALGPRVANGLMWSLVFLTGLLLVALIGRIGKAE